MGKSKEKQKNIVVKNKTIKSEKKRRSSRFGLAEVIVLVVTTMVVSLFMGGAVTYSIFYKSDLVVEEKELSELIENYHYIKENYYSEINTENLIDGAIKGMLEALGDRHSSFIEDGNASNFDKELQGSYEGVGIEVYNLDDGIYINRVFANSSAADAGLKPGDKIISVDKKNLIGKTTSEFSDYIKNKKGNTFEIVYERDKKQETVTLKRKFVVIPSVTSKVLEENNKKIGYINISTFSATTTNQFEKELKKLETQKIDSLILDLRGNSGGHLSVVKDMLSLLMDKTHIIYQIESKEETIKYYSEGTENKMYPIVVLQNKSSASASELMASALQEQVNAIVVGTTSYGKGTVQEVVNLTNGNQYKFTTKKWLTSKGNWINGIGVKPNIEVELDSKYIETFEDIDDNQLQTAIREASK